METIYFKTVEEMKQYRITLVISFGIIGAVLLFALVYSFMMWLTQSKPLALNWGVFSCTAIFIALMVDLSKSPPEPLSEDLKPKGFKSTAIPDEESLKEIPVENRINYATDTVSKTEHSPSYDDINEYEERKGINT